MKKMGGVAMVTILSSSTKYHGKCSQCLAFDIKQNPAGRSPEDRQSKSHGEINSRAPWFLKPAEPLFYFHHLVEYSTKYKYKCGGDLSRSSLSYTFEISHKCIAQHRLHQHDKRQGKDTKFSQPLGLAESPLP